MNGIEELSALKHVERILVEADISKAPFELRLDAKQFQHIAIGGYMHLPLEQQLIKWAERRGWLASEVPTENGVIRITKTTNENDPHSLHPLHPAL